MCWPVNIMQEDVTECGCGVLDLLLLMPVVVHVVLLVRRSGVG